MGEVVHVTFGTEREWEHTREKTVDGLVAVGSLVGDDESLMRAKADCIYGMLREMVEKVPALRINTSLPDTLTPPEIDAVTEAVRKAAHTGIEAGVTHCVQVIMAGIYDLCTSKLRSA